MFLCSLYRLSRTATRSGEFHGASSMPCFLFTYHAHGSWLPDRARGYVKRGQGILPLDNHMHRLYSESMTQPIVVFKSDIQLQLIETILESSSKQNFEIYFIATDSTHVHVLLGWRDNRRGTRLRGQLKWSLSHALNLKLQKRKWVAEKVSCKQVKDRQHFDYLRNSYLPKHTGWKWRPDLGLHK